MFLSYKETLLNDRGIGFTNKCVVSYLTCVLLSQHQGQRVVDAARESDLSVDALCEKLRVSVNHLLHSAFT